MLGGMSLSPLPDKYKIGTVILGTLILDIYWFLYIHFGMYLTNFTSNNDFATSGILVNVFSTITQRIRELFSAREAKSIATAPPNEIKNYYLYQCNIISKLVSFLKSFNTRAISLFRNKMLMLHEKIHIFEMQNLCFFILFLNEYAPTLCQHRPVH